VPYNNNNTNILTSAAATTITTTTTILWTFCWHLQLRTGEYGAQIYWLHALAEGTSKFRLWTRCEIGILHKRKVTNVSKQWKM